jgi:hypothetical protein
MPRSSLLEDVTHRRLVVTDVSGQPIFNGQAVEEEKLELPRQNSDVSGNTQLMWAMFGVSVGS